MGIRGDNSRPNSVFPPPDSSSAISDPTEGLQPTADYLRENVTHLANVAPFPAQFFSPQRQHAQAQGQLPNWGTDQPSELPPPRQDQPGPRGSVGGWSPTVSLECGNRTYILSGIPGRVLSRNLKGFLFDNLPQVVALLTIKSPYFGHCP
jgi:hypothetical protein